MRVYVSVCVCTMFLKKKVRHLSNNVVGTRSYGLVCRYAYWRRFASCCTRSRWNVLAKLLPGLGQQKYDSAFFFAKILKYAFELDCQCIGVGELLVHS
jgi:hypothetical protein